MFLMWSNFVDFGVGVCRLLFPAFITPVATCVFPWVGWGRVCSCFYSVSVLIGVGRASCSSYRNLFGPWGFLFVFTVSGPKLSDSVATYLLPPARLPVVLVNTTGSRYLFFVQLDINHSLTHSAFSLDSHADSRLIPSCFSTNFTSSEDTIMWVSIP